MPLNRWVAWVAPVSTAADATSAVASVCPTATVTPALAAARITPAAPGSSGASVMTRRCPRGRSVQSLEDGHVGSEHVPRVLGAAPGRGQERPLQVQAVDHALIGQAGQQGGAGLELGERRGDQAGQQARAAVRAVKRGGGPSVLAVPSVNDVPPPPCTCRSTKPGSTHCPFSSARQAPAGLLARVAGTDGGDQAPPVTGSSRGPARHLASPPGRRQ